MMHAKPEAVRARRLRRRLKAVASIAVAMCAGVFLACQRTTPSMEPEPGGRARDADSVGKDGAADDGSVGDGGGDASDAKSEALVRHDGGVRDAAVDRKEHRKGMPVPDNLLE